jgi:hypothetical protein
MRGLVSSYEESKMGIELKRTVVAVVAVALLGTGPALASPPAQSPDVPDQDHLAILSGRASILLAEIQKETAELLAEIQKETAELRPRPYTEGTFAWNAQYTLLNRVTFLDRAEGHINAVGERVAKLQHIRRLVLRWQQQAITEVTSHATRVKASIQAAIVHLRENQNRLLVAEYRDHLTTIEDRSEDMKQTVDKFLNHEKFLSNALQCWLSVGVLCWVELSVCFAQSSCRGVFLELLELSC